MFKKIYNILKQYFFADNSTDDTKIDDKKKDDRPCLCSIDLQLNMDDTINIMCYWPNLEKLDENMVNLIADKYAMMLYLLNNGFLKKDTIDTLSDISRKPNGNDEYFVTRVLSKWLDISEKYSTEYEESFIRPSSVFKRYETGNKY